MTEVATYLGQKGYTIYKNNICVKEKQYIRDELMVRPYMPKAPVQPPPFPVYRESSSKIYLPRFFGIENYGEPDSINISDGSDISLEFTGDLRDYQKNIVSTYLKNVDPIKGGGGSLEIPCGRG